MAVSDPSPYPTEEELLAGGAPTPDLDIPEGWRKVFDYCRAFVDIPWWLKPGVTMLTGWAEGMVARDPEAARATFANVMREVAAHLEIRPEEVFPDEQTVR